MESGIQLDMTMIESRYDAIPYTIKEFAGFPTRYIYLSHDQKELVDALIGGEYKSKKELDIEEDLGYIRDITSEVSEMTSALLRRYHGAGK